MAVSSFTLAGPDFFHSEKIRHVVIFKFKPEVTYRQMEQVSEHFHSLKEKIPQIIELEGGADFRLPKQETENNSFTHCFIVTVKNKEDLAAYGAHPEHKAFSASADPLLQEVIVVDYFTK